MRKAINPQMSREDRDFVNALRNVLGMSPLFGREEESIYSPEVHRDGFPILISSATDLTETSGNAARPRFKRGVFASLR